jgi:mono/diheme cytochrome c family protein
MHRAVKIRTTTVALLALIAMRCSANQGASSNATMQSGDDNAQRTEPVAQPDAIEPDAVSAAVEPSADAAVATMATMDAAASADAAPAAISDAAVADARAPRATGATGTGTRTTGTSTSTGTSATASPAVAEGRVVFDRTCGRCHPGGNNRVGPRLTGRNDSEAHTRQVIRSGDGTMRPIPTSRLSDDDLAKVIVFLRSIRAVR